MTEREALKLALEALELEDMACRYEKDQTPQHITKAIVAIKEALAEQETVTWISVKDALPKAVRGVSYNRSLTDVVLVRHSDRPDYPITAHAVVGEGLGAGIAIPTNNASEHPQIAWYTECRDLKNPFGLKNDDYKRYLPKIFGSKITHWKPIDTAIREALEQPEQEPVAWETFALKFANGKGLSYEKPKNLPKYLACRPLIYQTVPSSDTSQERVDETSKQRHEPVAYGMWDTMLGKENRMMMVRLDKGQDGCTVPLYTPPPQRTWVGLTNEDFLEACQIAERGNYLVAFQRIQAKLRSKNT